MIYLLEDDDNIRGFVVYALRASGYDSEGFDTPSGFYAALEKNLPDLIMLDIMLPEEDGLSVLRRIRSRSRTAEIPVIMLTAKGTEYDRVMGLDSGADDYVAKPFGTMELISRVKALLRRAGGFVKEPDEYHVGDLRICPSKHTVMAGDKAAALTLKEYELLLMLVKGRGSVFTRDQILRQIWGYEFDGENRTVDVHIRTLRSKLGECGGLVETVRGVGYRIGGSDT